jgi:hypothetical protein
VATQEAGKTPPMEVEAEHPLVEMEKIASLVDVQEAGKAPPMAVEAGTPLVEMRRWQPSWLHRRWARCSQWRWMLGRP